MRLFDEAEKQDIERQIDAVKSSRDMPYLKECYINAVLGALRGYMARGYEIRDYLSALDEACDGVKKDRG